MLFDTVAAPVFATESSYCCWNLNCWNCHDWSCGWNLTKDYRCRLPVHRSPADRSDDGDGARGVCCCYAGPYLSVEPRPKLSKRSVDNLCRLQPIAHLEGREGEREKGERIKK